LVQERPVLYRLSVQENLRTFSPVRFGTPK
jgi:hypothetical protein